eukprot:CAMPEP_0168783240 /NCGR_PEP_ID=MMETSP0725-20121227/9581_1 /TAXON_ID=265536 /ORGANISM="Amphiprora sp., Strain CCMP467" /LENGTH=52 /DNA_ID=CAMNT_0008833205 /DNA_START=217 /DNA_END=375 /DNA_ORIENTATION=+
MTEGFPPSQNGACWGRDQDGNVLCRTPSGREHRFLELVISKRGYGQARKEAR